MNNTKYGEMLEDHEWKIDVEQPERTTIGSHTIDILYNREPDQSDNYGRDKFTLHIQYEENKPYVTHVVKHRWKGNYWRDVTDLDIRDVPEPVKDRVVSVLAINSIEEITSDVRVIPEGGESRWKKYHKPQMDKMDSGEMWGTSYLSDALRSLEGAAEAFEDGSKVQSMTEQLIQTTKKIGQYARQNNE